MLNYFFFNLNFNHSFNQISIFSNQPQLKILFIKKKFKNYNHNNYRKIKNTLNINLSKFNSFILKYFNYPFYHKQELTSWDDGKYNWQSGPYLSSKRGRFWISKSIVSHTLRKWVNFFFLKNLIEWLFI